MNRLAELVIIAMVMFTLGVLVFAFANDTSEHLLGGAAILGAIAVVVANVTGNGKGGK